jgi:hypothetical protein
MTIVMPYPGNHDPRKGEAVINETAGIVYLRVAISDRKQIYINFLTIVK